MSGAEGEDRGGDVSGVGIGGLGWRSANQGKILFDEAEGYKYTLRRIACGFSFMSVGPLRKAFLGTLSVNGKPRPE